MIMISLYYRISRVRIHLPGCQVHLPSSHTGHFPQCTHRVLTFRVLVTQFQISSLGINKLSDILRSFFVGTGSVSLKIGSRSG